MKSLVASAAHDWGLMRNDTFAVSVFSYKDIREQ